MTRVKRLALAAGLALATMLTAASAIAATTAQGAEGPYYTVESVRLEGKALAKIDGKAGKAYVLTAGAIKVTCEKLKLENGAILGSNGANGAVGEAAILFEACTVAGNGEKCEVTGKKITTKPLKSTLAFTNKESKAGEIMLVHFAPVTGALATVTFAGTCIFKETVVEGSVDGEAWGGGKALKVSEEPLDAATREVNFPAAAIKTSFIEEEKVRKEVKPALTAFGKAATLEGRAELTLASKESWNVAATLPPPPQVERIDFLNTEAIEVDHLKDADHEKLLKLREEGLPAPEKPIELEQFGALDKWEWKSSKLGALATNWPLAFPKKTTTIELKARFELEPATTAFLEKLLDKDPTFVGETTIGGVAMKFEATIKDVAAQIKAHGTYLETPTIKASAALPDKVKYEQPTITWKWTAKEKERAVAIEQKAGKSTHNVYLTVEKAKGTIYLTLLDLDTQNIELEAQVLPAIWKGFSTVELGLPSVHIRIYNPATGELKRTGAVLWYYHEIPVELTLTQYLKFESQACFIGGTEGLLEWAMGECGAWREAFLSARGAEGGEDTKVMVVVQSAKGACAIEETCAMLVKEWKFEGKGTSGNAEFPYKESEVKDVSGMVGQGVKNPSSFFYNHQIIEGEKKLYDPSYGTGPLGTGAESPLGGGEEAKEIQLSYQEKAISGFCALTEAKKEYNCRKVEKGESWLKFKVV